MTFEKAGLRTLLWRAIRLRCPHCGGGGLFESFFKIKKQCPTCGLRLERGESDYFVGAYLFNLIAVELILFAMMIFLAVRSGIQPIGLPGWAFPIF